MPVENSLYPTFDDTEELDHGICNRHHCPPRCKGPYCFGQAGQGVSSYRLHQESDGRLILEPFVEIPERERWLYKNQPLLASVEAGLRDVAAGRIVSLGSFAQYADDDREKD